jgi:hypothetical protein
LEHLGIPAAATFFSRASSNQRSVSANDLRLATRFSLASGQVKPNSQKMTHVDTRAVATEAIEGSTKQLAITRYKHMTKTKPRDTLYFLFEKVAVLVIFVE